MRKKCGEARLFVRKRARPQLAVRASGSQAAYIDNAIMSHEFGAQAIIASTLNALVGPNISIATKAQIDHAQSDDVFELAKPPLNRPRVLRGLNTLRGLSLDEIKQVFTRGA